jgi:hypothetical protein
VIETSDYSVYAVKYATRDARSGEHFYGHDLHDVGMPGLFRVGRSVR